MYDSQNHDTDMNLHTKYRCARGENIEAIRHLRISAVSLLLFELCPRRSVFLFPPSLSLSVISQSVSRDAECYFGHRSDEICRRWTGDTIPALTKSTRRRNAAQIVLAKSHTQSLRQMIPLA